MSKELSEKLTVLKEYIKDLGSLAIGFSGGVDSTLMLAVAHEVLGDKALAITMAGASIPELSIAHRAGVTVSFHTPLRLSTRRSRRRGRPAPT